MQLGHVNTSAETSLDLQVRALRDAGDLRAAATLALQTYGGTVLRVLAARFRDEDQTGEVFSRFAEALWNALPSFAFRCSVRAFLFTLARNEGNRYLARDLRRERRNVRIATAHPLDEQVQSVRISTAPHLRTDNRDRLQQLRDQLSDDDQLLLTLRIDRALEYREIAAVFLGDPDASAEALTRESARLRKRLQAIKDQLRAMLGRSAPQT